MTSKNPYDIIFATLISTIELSTESLAKLILFELEKEASSRCTSKGSIPAVLFYSEPQFMEILAINNLEDSE